MTKQALNKTKIFTTHSSFETKHLASRLAHHLGAGDVILLKGELGAGKTQFSQGLAWGLGIMDTVISPTFNILLEYHAGHVPLYHFDLYRLNDEEELEDIAFYETIEGDGVSVIEWWDKFPDCMPEEYLSIELCLPVYASGPSGHTIANRTHDESTITTSATDKSTIATCAPDERIITVSAIGARYLELIDLWGKNN